MYSRDRRQEEVRERLRMFGLHFSSIISRNPEKWIGAAAWLQRLPICEAVAETHDLAALDSGQEYILLPDLPPHLPIYSYSVEERAARTWGPICRRMFNGWDAALYRFSKRYTDRYFDFGIEDARRIALLAALTFNRDFDGACVGLNWTWDPPNDAVVSFEGRVWAWSKTSSGFGHEESLLRYMEKAAECLHANNPNQELADLLRKGEQASRSAEIVGPIVSGVADYVSNIVNEMHNTDSGRSTKGRRVSRKSKRRRGRPHAADPREDAQIAAAWATGEHKQMKDLASALNKTEAEVRKAIDRRRHSRDKSG
jgi:hypothetical protein